MKNTGIQKYNPLKNTLEPRSYTLFLLREGLRRGILNQKAVDEFQEELMPLLAELILKYTRGESSSVTVETAQRLLGSLLYSIDAYLRSFRHKEAALNCLSSFGAAEIYEKGQALTSSCQKQTWLLYEEVRERKLNIPINAYHCTIDEDLPDFLKQYDPLLMLRILWPIWTIPCFPMTCVGREYFILNNICKSCLWKLIFASYFPPLTSTSC